MRFTGSFQTIVTHGRSGATTSSVAASFCSTGASDRVDGVTRPTLGPPGGRGVPPTRLRLPTDPNHVHRLWTVSPTSPRAASTALLTDHYELTMVQAALASGEAHRRCVFEAFARRLPDGR